MRIIISPAKKMNVDVDSFAVEELPQFGFELSEVTRDLHANGPVGVMTDYEAKFHALGQPINRCVGIKKEGYIPVLKREETEPEETEKQNESEE